MSDEAPSPPALGRRALLTGAAALSALLATDPAAALGRVPTGGTLRMRVAWSTRRLDPHDLFDPLAALFGTAIADPVYQLDYQGKPYPTLADGMPTVQDGQTVVHLRPGMRTAKGKALGGRDLAWSVSRARQQGAAGLLAPLPRYVRSSKDDPLIARFGKTDPLKLAVLLASPLVSLLPVGFSATSPDGSGPFRARCSASSLELTRNRNAARGPSFLERVIVRSAPDLAASLRAFESGQDDVGWLGLGLHRNRARARKFNYGRVGWVVLATGRQAGRYAAPGVAQQLANAVPAERLHLGLSPRRGLGAGTPWRGDPATLLYDSSSGHLKTIAEAVAVKLSEPGHEVTATPVSRARLRRARATNDFALALDVVRHPAAGPTGALIALSTADRKSLGKDVALHPPRGNYSRPGHQLTTTLRLGVLGGLAVRGGVIKQVLLAAARRGGGLDLGASYRSP